MKELEGVIEIGTSSANVIFGQTGGNIISLTIGILLISSISSMAWIGPRVIEKMAEQHSVYFLTKKNNNGIPVAAIVLQYILTLTLLFTGSFVQILTYTGIALNISSCLAVSVLFRNIKISKLRYMLAPILFMCINILTVFMLLFGYN